VHSSNQTLSLGFDADPDRKDRSSPVGIEQESTQSQLVAEHSLIRTAYRMVSLQIRVDLEHKDRS